MRSLSPVTERAQPLLGTVVRMRVEGLAPHRAHEAISGAFDIVADVHRLMSFHEPDSEISHLNGAAWRIPLRVSAHTKAVLERALKIARDSDGLFDPTVAPRLVEDGLLPTPCGTAPDPQASWRDIILHEDDTVAFGRPLWIDFGGIAKGYAVDCAMTHLETYRPGRACVNAGGDLKLSGPDAEYIYLAAPGATDSLPALEVTNAAVASSESRSSHGGGNGDTPMGCQIDTRTKTYCPSGRFVTVVAPQCIDADALTKVVMTVGIASIPILEQYQAKAFLFDKGSWLSISESHQANGD